MSKHPREDDEFDGRTRKRPIRGRLSGEDAESLEPDDEDAERPGRTLSRDRRRRVEVEDGELDARAGGRGAWLPPARR